MVRPGFIETTSLGAALAAGLAVEFWDLEFVMTEPKDETTQFSPVVSQAETAKRYKDWKKAISKSLNLADLTGPLDEVTA